MTNINYPPNCDGCPQQLVDEPASLNTFKARCPLPGSERQLFNRWGFTLRNGGNCAQRAVSEVVVVDMDSIDEQAK